MARIVLRSFVVWANLQSLLALFIVRPDVSRLASAEDSSIERVIRRASSAFSVETAKNLFRWPLQIIVIVKRNGK